MSELQVVGPRTDAFVARARVCHGKWVADCPHPDCRGAEHFHDPYAPPGFEWGGLTRTAFHCRAQDGCRLSYPVVWPPNAVEIDRALGLRPIMTTRNWNPGETLADLVVENLAHGIVELPPIDEVPDGRLFQIINDDVEPGPVSVGADVAKLAIGAG